MQGTICATEHGRPGVTLVKIETVPDLRLCSLKGLIRQFEVFIVMSARHHQTLHIYDFS